METKLILTIWGLLFFALFVLGGVWFLARRRGVSPDEILRARPGLVMGAVALWGTAVAFAALAWAWTEIQAWGGPAWLLIVLAPGGAVVGWMLGLRQAEREHSFSEPKGGGENA